MSSSKRWTAEDIPDLSGKTVIVTGGNSGVGFQAAWVLAAKRAHVVLACRDTEKASAATDRIRQIHQDASLESILLDLANLDSIRAFARAFLQDHQSLHVLLNNAGVMALPRQTTADGFEMQLGTNHLGHFALTGLLLERLLQTPQARVVTVSSAVHRMGRMRFHDLNWERGYQNWLAYCQSKLANLLFTNELQRRLAASNANIMAVACHPGYSNTNLQQVGPRMRGARLEQGIMRFANTTFAQSPRIGALSLLYAAVAPGLQGGDCIGPRFIETWGYPVKVGMSARARNAEDAARLWDISERLTGVRYELNN